MYNFHKACRYIKMLNYMILSFRRKNKKKKREREKEKDGERQREGERRRYEGSERGRKG